MNARGLALKFAAAAAIAAAASMCVVSAGYALFALVEPELGSAGAAAVVALAAAAVTLIAALLMFRDGERRDLKHRAAGWTDHLVETARERPLAVAALVAAARWILARNPALVSLAASAFSERARDRRR